MSRDTKLYRVEVVYQCPHLHCREKFTDSHVCWYFEDPPLFATEPKGDG